MVPNSGNEQLPRYWLKFGVTALRADYMMSMQYGKSQSFALIGRPYHDQTTWESHIARADRSTLPRFHNITKSEAYEVSNQVVTIPHTLLKHRPLLAPSPQIHDDRQQPDNAQTCRSGNRPKPRECLRTLIESSAWSMLVNDGRYRRLE